MPGQRAIPEVMRWRPQQDSNLRSRLRRALTKMVLTSAGTRRGQVPGG